MDVINESLERNVYRKFWNKFSEKADNKSMMLNKNADELEKFDREDILASLPDFTGMDVADIGAGIGRFTTIFAERARRVISTDFMESFIQKNRERNSNFSNIDYIVSDTVGLELEPGSLGLLFTNWLLMYLSDEENVNFLLNAIEWLKPGGYLHLRESCSEPSTGRLLTYFLKKYLGRVVASTLHADSNPTHYRFSSVYTELLRSIRMVDSDGKHWRLNVQWACSVPTYIERQSNWRQVHWLAQKVEIEKDAILVYLLKNTALTFSQTALRSDSAPILRNALAKHLVGKITQEWPQKQALWDQILDVEKFIWTDNIFKTVYNEISLPKGSTILSFNSRKLTYHLHVNTHGLVERFACNLWNVETNSFFYRTSLTKANTLKDQRVRISWNNDLESALRLLKLSTTTATFNGIFATELLSEIPDNAESVPQIVDNIAGILMANGFLVCLEPIPDTDDDIRKTVKKIKFLENRFKLITVEEVTSLAELSIHEYFMGSNQQECIKMNGLRWLLIHAQLY